MSFKTKDEWRAAIDEYRAEQVRGEWSPELERMVDELLALEKIKPWMVRE